jgi:subfamily B ATP-binding cassette protein MsbA
MGTAWREARELVWARRGRLSVGLGVMLVSRLAGLVLPASSKVLIDEVIGKGRQELLLPLALGAGAATLVQAGTSFGLSRLLGITAQRSITDMRRRVEEHLARLPVRFFDSQKSGALVARVMNDAEGIRNLVGTGLVNLVGGAVTAAIALGVLFWLSWQLTTATLVVLAGFGGLMFWFFKRLRPIFRERGELYSQVTGRLSEALGGIRIVKVYTAEKREDLVFTKGVHRLFRNVAKSMTAVSGFEAVATVIFGLVGVVMMLVGGRLILAGSMTLGDFVMYIFFTGMVVAPVVQIASIGTQITEAFAGLDRIRELLGVDTEDADAANRSPLPTVRGEVVFDDVWFEYEPDKPVLKGVSFAAKAGSTTALVGSSGSGKSTLVGLVTTFQKPTSGTITIDGRDLTSVRLFDYRSHLGVVLQDNFLFDGSIAQNIAYGRPGATREEVEEAAKVAHCDGFVASFTEGYDTIVGERGVKLSGGQKQRVAIARAILADPAILILDEATSSLDSESESLIQEALVRLRSGRTTFVIAHRLSTIRSADQILVVEDGQIVERGTHAELLAAGGRYKELYDRQYRHEADLFLNPGDVLMSTEELERLRSEAAAAPVARSGGDWD